MATIVRAEECPIDPIAGWTLAVLGYGNQGRAQALNLRDTGHAVIVSARPGGWSAECASADGFQVISPEALGDHADLVAVLIPDEAQAGVIGRLARRGAGRVRMLVFAHGFSLRFDPPDSAPEWDLAVVAPAGPGVQLRDRYLQGSGLPALLAVHRDVSGQAEARARAYGASLGCARAGMIGVTMAQEVEIDLFGEQVVLCGGMNALTRAAFEVLIDAGYPPEAAYLECVQQLRLTAELLERFGPEGMRRRISPTALYGDLTRGERILGPGVRERMAEVLAEIRSGAFARSWMKTAREDPARLEQLLGESTAAGLEAAGEIVRGLFAGEMVRPNPGSERGGPPGTPAG